METPARPAALSVSFGDSRREKVASLVVLGVASAVSVLVLAVNYVP